MIEDVIEPMASNGMRTICIAYKDFVSASQYINLLVIFCLSLLKNSFLYFFIGNMIKRSNLYSFLGNSLLRIDFKLSTLFCIVINKFTCHTQTIMTELEIMLSCSFRSGW